MVLTPGQDRRVPSVSERELLMGFDRDCIAAAISEKTSARSAFLDGASLIRNSFCVPILAYVVAELLVDSKYIDVALLSEMGLALKACDKPWASNPVCTSGGGVVFPNKKKS